MLTLHLPRFTKENYATSNFSDMQNLHRQTEYNRRDFRVYMERTPFNIENQHPLVGLLQQLSIDPTWDLNYAIEYIRFKSNTLASEFKINNISGKGNLILNGFYREGVNEQWILLDNVKKYTPNVDPYSLRAVVPLYSTVVKRGYKHTVEKSPKVAGTDYAIVGIDLVELGIGWWLWMNDPAREGTGIHNYVCKIPLANATLIHNQLTVINILYEFLVNEKPLSELLVTETVKFSTLNEERLLNLYFGFLIDWMTSRKLDELGHLMSQLKPIYREDYTHFVGGGKHALFAQTCWGYEPAVLKLYAIYLSVCNRMKRRASDINAVFIRAYPVMAGNYVRNIQSLGLRNHLLELLEEVNELNIENMK